VALDEWGRVYVTDTGNRRIVVFDSGGTVIRVMPGPNDGFSFVDGPVMIAIGDGANYWSYFRRERVMCCADSGGSRIRKLDLNGRSIKSIALPSGHLAAYGATDYYHNLWITDKGGHCVLKYDHNLELLDTFGSYGKRDNEFVQPRGIAIWKRYGQTFIAEKTGAQYYWVGTKLKRFELRAGREPRRFLLMTDVTEYSYVSLFRADEADTSFFLKKRVVASGRRTTNVFMPPSAAAGNGLTLRVEPTYSSYTYYHKDYPVHVER
jgi:hypothetical protein